MDFSPLVSESHPRRKQLVVRKIHLTWKPFKMHIICVSELATVKMNDGPLRRTLNTSTLTVVIATSCGVLGLLVIVMVVVALKRRHKPRSSRACHPSTPPPPPYPSPPSGLVDDPDRVALIAFADGVQVYNNYLDVLSKLIECTKYLFIFISQHPS